MVYYALSPVSDGRGNWSTFGCNLTSVEEEGETGIATCSCNHLTNFAILVVRPAEESKNNCV